MAKGKDPKPIDAVLRMAIINSDVSRYKIAKDCEISYGSLHRFVSGERDIRFQAAVKLARYLKLELVPWEMDR